MDAPAPPPSRFVARLLPPEEWDAHRDVLPDSLFDLDRAYTLLLVVEDTQKGQIAASWCALNTVHLEGLFIQPAYRHNIRVPVVLLSGMIDALIEGKIGAALTIARDPLIAGLAETAGFTPVEGTLYQLRVPIPAPAVPPPIPPPDGGC